MHLNGIIETDPLAPIDPAIFNTEKFAEWDLRNLLPGTADTTTEKSMLPAIAAFLAVTYLFLSRG